MEPSAISEFGRIYRNASAAVTARLIRKLGGDVALAEEVVQEAFAAALEQGPAQGTPSIRAPG